MHIAYAWVCVCMCAHACALNKWRKTCGNKENETKRTEWQVQEKWEKMPDFLCRTPTAQKAFMIFSHVLMSYSEKNKKITNKILVPLITVNDNDFACQTIPRAHQMWLLRTQMFRAKKNISYICNIFQNVQLIDFWCFICTGRNGMNKIRALPIFLSPSLLSRTLAVCKRRHDSCAVWHSKKEDDSLVFFNWFSTALNGLKNSIE